jgi:hypothetical protein
MAYGNMSQRTRVYEYGCGEPTTNADRLDEQLLLAHRYKNKLTEIERARREKVRAIISEHGDVAPLEDEVAAQASTLKELRETIKRARVAARSRGADTGLLERQAKELASQLKERRAELRAIRKAIANDPQTKARLHETDQQARDAVKATRAESGLYWGTYLSVEQDMDRARKGRMDPRFRRWTGDGRVSVQMQGGATVAAVLGGDDTRLQIDPPDPAAWSSPVRGERRRAARTTCRIRVGSMGRAPLWCELPVTMHRPLPANGRIKWAHVHRSRVGRKHRYKLLVVVSFEEHEPTPSGSDVVAIDLGWRAVDVPQDGEARRALRVGYWQDTSGDHGQVLLEPGILERLKTCERLRSIRDQHLDEMRPRLVEWARDADLPEWWAERAETLAQWRSAARLAALMMHWRENRFDGDEEMFAAAEAWRKQDAHLYDWESNLRDKVTRRRREAYRVFAAQVARRYKAVILEHFDLRRVARKAAPEGEADANQAARHHRTWAAVSTLRQAIIDACEREGLDVITMPSAYTTRTCHQCGSVESWDQAEQILHRCSQCGDVWDQDRNAAINLLAAGLGERCSDDEKAGSARAF